MRPAPRPLLTASLRAASLLLVVAVAGPAVAAPEVPEGRDPWPQQQCLAAAGKTACGHACVAAYGDLQCAAVPWGACLSAYGKIVCGPDRPSVEPPGQRWRQIPRATCLAAAGDIACGWGCVAGPTGPACSPRPGGICTPAYGKVTCSGGGVGDGDGGPGGPTPECKSAYGKTACGFGCVAAAGDVRCAAHPDGRCVAAYGRVTCSDGGGGPRAPRSHCQSAYGKTACGYSCVAAYGDVRCASRPDGRCIAAQGKITCSE